MIRFGGPVYLKGAGNPGFKENYSVDSADPVALAKAHKAKGYSSAYAPAADINDTARIAEIRRSFEKENVMIAEVGYWQNLLDTDPETRRKNREEMVEALMLAEELGAQCAVNLLGSYCQGYGASMHTGSNFSEEAFEEAVDMARYFIDTVKPKTAFFTYEIFPFNVIDSPLMIQSLVKAVDRRQFGVHLDLVNLINSPRKYWRSGDIIRECVRLFGDSIVCAHVKDIKMKEPAISVILEEVLPGQGMIDMASFIREIHKLKREVPFMMEHLSTEQEYDKAALYIREIAAREGISL